MPSNHDILRSRVRLLGSFLGEAIARQSGQDTVETIEVLRKGFIQERLSPNPENKQKLIDLIASLDNKTLQNVIRGFSIYFFSQPHRRELLTTRAKHLKKKTLTIIGKGRFAILY